MSSSEDIYTFGLDMLTVALDAPTEGDAIEGVRGIASDLDVDDLRRVVTMLAVEAIWQARPRRSRRAMREWIELRRFAAMTTGLEQDGR